MADEKLPECGESPNFLDVAYIIWSFRNAKPVSIGASAEQVATEYGVSQSALEQKIQLEETLYRLQP